MITLNEFLWLVIILLALCVSSLYKQKIQLEEELEKLKDDRHLEKILNKNRLILEVGCVI